MIDLERWPEIKAIVQAALDLSDEERASYLCEICGDDEGLRREVETLLSVSTTRADFFDDFQVVPEHLQTATFIEGETVGPYRIIRRIGQGGMGAVYLAYDPEHDRSVALKVMPRSSWRLLREEKRLLARLQHPNIAILHDSGQTKSGFGYFVMEYIDGEPITAYCDAQRLSLQKRLELFLAVCDAVSVAHRSLIVHRDIKPSNILVTHNKGIPKLLDFGIAKLLPSEPSLQPEAISFTEAFASPEQLKGEHTTTATDIYSLGVLLCLLLTGSLPYPVKKYEDLPWAIRNMKPEKPSQLILKDLSRLDVDARPTVVPALNARKLSRQLRGDLDAIVLRALRKDANERYHSVQELVADIRRFLSHEPVSARDGGSIYKVRKVIERHRLAVILSSSIVIASIGLSIWFFILFHEAQYQRNQARIQQERSDAIKDFMVKSFELSDPFTPNPGDPTVRALLDKAAAEAEVELKSQPEQQVAILALIAHVYNNLGLLDKARLTAQSAVDRGVSRLPPTSPGLADALFSLGDIESASGNYSKAEELFRRSASIRLHAFGEANRDYADSLYSLGVVLFYQGKKDEAEKAYRKALSLQRTYNPNRTDAIVKSMTALALALKSSQRYGEAESLYRESIAIIRRDFGPYHPTLANTLDLLAQLLTDTKRFKDAEEMHREALAITQKSLGANHPDIVPRLYNLGFVLAFQGKNAEAEKIYRQALERSRSILGEKHQYSFVIGGTLARLLSKEKRHGEALNLILELEARALSIFGERSPIVISLNRHEAFILYEGGNVGAAEKQIRKVIDLLGRTPTAGPLEVEVSKSLLADCLVARRRFEDAEPLATGWYKVAPPREVPAALQKLVYLYTQWGKPQKAAEYNKLLAEAISSGAAR
jgi:serine/threonine protein kinase/Tfp pilus assembly protein PilF